MNSNKKILSMNAGKKSLDIKDQELTPEQQEFFDSAPSRSEVTNYINGILVNEYMPQIKKTTDTLRDTLEATICQLQGLTDVLVESGIFSDSGDITKAIDKASERNLKLSKYTAVLISTLSSNNDIKVSKDDLIRAINSKMIALHDNKELKIHSCSDEEFVKILDDAKAEIIAELTGQGK